MMNTLNEEEKEAPGQATIEKKEGHLQSIKNGAVETGKPAELKKEVTTPHDSVVQKFLQENETVKSFFREYLPQEILSLLDLDSLEFMKEKFVDEILARFYSDFLYKVKFLNREDCDEGFIYLLLEHKSTPYRFSGS